ncbi:MAG: hypothetical protein JXA67_06210 [Micromonosporaceae bacterium]|nr:hypothetical protein [Micromonosporaceae bacterium]
MLVLGLPDREAAFSLSLSLFAGEAALAFGLWEQMVFVGDLVEDVVEEIGQVFRRMWPRRRRCDERLPTGCGWNDTSSGSRPARSAIGEGNQEQAAEHGEQ